ncbi:MAG: hypothetical protein CPDRYMAC_5247 [uncultured Paraburkholderia sp.]|nr:MAG: hypothetical protein CPDRYDRY_5156 [uncultured Paraburkholderia sp.]CAH2940242.1 MAG: hypothetical protein CPDRYMAC_5247 [uncultured Paraburkholderia sp.]
MRSEGLCLTQAALSFFQSKNSAPFQGALFFMQQGRAYPFPVVLDADPIGIRWTGQKIPASSPGKRYVFQRIGAFGQLTPCEWQRHDAVAYYGNAGGV